ncbi:MAG: desulfoferrodoxin Dfx [Clostridiales Family XIII bacterium]|jgi:superoxide reductase|nr:desulfoferrodoxin Dfx [Clostridiales Family XIII bacterium]
MGKFYLCDICGNLFEAIEDVGVVPTCCGVDMTELSANSSDGAGEKHVPVLERDGKTLKVKIGSVSHPMEEKHYINWIAVEQGARVQRFALKPGAAPEAVFALDSAEGPVTAYEYCNLHGLWKAEG